MILEVCFSKDKLRLKWTLIAFIIIVVLANSGFGYETPQDKTAVSTAPVTPPAPFLPVPNLSQLEWHKDENRMFVHFGIKTYYPSGNHMGSGKEDPTSFNPRKFNAKQWVATAKAGGFKGIVLTLKHHEGFCIWQTDTTDFSVRSSSWQDGKGDILKELIEACREGEIKIGVYISILDLHFQQSGAAGYTDYSDFYYDQLLEISTKYGPLDEYWFDGFNADGMKVDYEKIAAMIKINQPHAVIYDSGTLVKYLPDRCLRWEGAHGGAKADQNYRVTIDNKVIWYPNEPSLILQGNWFHHGHPITSLKTMQNYYLNTIGHGVTPLMNIPANQDGLFDEDSIERLEVFKNWVDRIHANDLTQKVGVKVTADSVRGNDPVYGPQSVIDRKYDSYFATDDNIKTAVLEINLGKVQKIDGFILQEYIPLGQRVEGYCIECFVNDKWQEIFSGECIGYKRIILGGWTEASDRKFPATDRIRLKITDALACPLVNSFMVIGDNYGLKDGHW